MGLADAQAVRRTLEGEQDAFAALVLRYIGLAHSVAYGVLGDELDAEDVVQDAFLIAFQRLRDAALADSMDAEIAPLLTPEQRSRLERSRQPSLYLLKRKTQEGVRIDTLRTR